MSNDKAFKVKNGLELAGYDTSKAVTAVDVFVYDTSKDSDGGAWRKRTQHTSWYNETLNTATRGSRREFPAVAVIVAETNKVTIYDGDDPALPMWMVFIASFEFMLGADGGNHSLAAFNGWLVFGSLLYDVKVIDFIADRAARSGAGILGDYKGVIADRNGNKSWTVGSNLLPGAIVNRTVNDVAMTVLPNAPIDPATGLPVPTIAVATAGGVSVITDSGAVYDTTVGFTPVSKVAFDAGSGLWWYRNSALYLTYATVTDYTAADDFGDIVASNTVGNQEFDLQVGSVATALDVVGEGDLFIGGTGVGRHYLNTSALVSAANTHLHAYTTSTYNTGWMNGDIKGAFLSDTDATSVVGSGELVTNGTFDTDTTGWSNTSATIASVSGELQVSSQTDSPSATTQAVSGLVVGKVYAVTATYFQTGTGGTAARVSFFGILSENNSTSTPVTKTIYATATQTAATLSLQSFGTSSTISHFDNVSVKLADADRSVNNKGLIVNGTVTRTAVATGADLVAYSGFSASNYLEQPYNSGLDFGTGDFCVMGWVNGSSTFRYILERIDVADTGAGFIIYRGSSDLEVYIRSGATSIKVASAPLTNNLDQFFVAKRSGTTWSLSVNAVEGTTGTSAVNLTNTSASLRIGTGVRSASNSLAWNGSIALLRISATAPTASQIAKIYNDEKFLFQDNAQATLYGASDAVTALAHDDATNLLHVGTSAGRSVFQGLRRVENTTTAVGTAISASNSLVVEE